jgi:hypothetical protein
MMSQWHTITAVTELRKASADVVSLCDVIIFGHTGEAMVARPMLNARMERLAARLQQAQRALTEGNQCT